MADVFFLRNMPINIHLIIFMIMSRSVADTPLKERCSYPKRVSVQEALLNLTITKTFNNKFKLTKILQIMVLNIQMMI